MARVHGQSARIYLDEYNLSGRTNKVELIMDQDMPEVTCFEDTGKAFVVGRPGWTANYEGFADYTAAEIDAIIEAAKTGTHNVGIYMAGSGAAGYEGVGILKMQSRESENSDAAKMKWSITGAEGAFLGRGVLISNGLAVTGTGAQTGVSFGGTVAVGKTVRLTSRVIAVSGAGSLTVALQESSDNGGGDPYATIIAGTAQTAVGAVVSTTVAGGTLGAWFRTNVTAFSGFTSVTLRTSVTVLG